MKLDWQHKARRIGKAAVLAWAAIAGCGGSALAHVSIEAREARIGASQKIVLRVPHGCQGTAMLKLRVQIPEGFYGVKPQPKAGWKMETVTGPYKTPQKADHHGPELTQGVREIAWTGKLEDQHYDEFVFIGQVGTTLKPDTMLYFPVVQECEKGVERWIDVPAHGASGGHSHDLKSPAPGIKILPRR